jgi:N-hydroxyarylamine O-acetyltransferase
MSDNAFDVQAYLDRIGHHGPHEPTLAVLRSIVAHHTATIPFENIDVLLGRAVRLDLPTLSAKIVRGQRGGYCFEHNSLLLAALSAVGFKVTGLMGRVVRGGPVTAATPRTHMLLSVDLPEGPHLADVGYGNLTATAPLALRPGIAQPTGHEDYRLVPLADELVLEARLDELVLEARLDETWQPLYRFPLQPQFPIDFEVGNWFTSTVPGGRFRENLVVARPAPGRRYTLFNRRFSIRSLAGETEYRDIRGVEAYGAVLREYFDLAMDAADLEAIEAAMSVRGHGAAGSPLFA